jgi:hypothetical protein
MVCMATRLNVLEGRFEGSSRNGDRGCVEHAITLSSGEVGEGSLRCERIDITILDIKLSARIA